MIFVGHRLAEVRAVADRVVVLRNGRLVSDLTPAEATEQRLVRDMVGKDLLPEGEHRRARRAERHSRSRRGSSRRRASARSISRVRPGEVVGVAGLMGSGRSRLLHVVMGARPSTGGEMRLGGRALPPAQRRRRRRRGRRSRARGPQDPGAAGGRADPLERHARDPAPDLLAAARPRARRPSGARRRRSCDAPASAARRPSSRRARCRAATSSA